MGLGFGLKWSGTLENTGDVDFMLVLGLFFLPVLVTTSTGVWLLEQARVMRAGNYLYHLEYYINRQLETNPVAWESWLRGEWESLSREPDGSLTQRFRDRLASPQHVYNWAFIIGYPMYFLTLTVVSLLLVYQLRTVIPGGIIIVGILGAAVISVSVTLAVAAFLQINHGIHAGTDLFPNYLLFLQDTFDKEPGVHVEHLFRLHKQELEDLPLDADTVHGQFEELIELAKEDEEG